MYRFNSLKRWIIGVASVILVIFAVVAGAQVKSSDDKSVIPTVRDEVQPKSSMDRVSPVDTKKDTLKPLAVDYSFSDGATAAGLTAGTGNKLSTPAWGDYNNDGYEDVYITTYSSQANRLYKNNGNGTFTEYTTPNPAGKYTMGAAWGDYDNDGDLDLFIANYYHLAAGANNTLYRNDGGGTFTDVSASAGTITNGMYHWACAWGDYNNDGFLDILVTAVYDATYGGYIYLYSNDGDGTFTNIATNITEGINSRSCAWADYNKDGNLDFCITAYGSTPRLWKNNGDSTFTNAAATAGLTTALNAYSVAWGDYNNDGWLDLYFGVNGANKLYKNNGNGTFTDVTTTAGVGDASNSYGGLWLDFDNDGNMDIYVNNNGAANKLYQNSGAPNYTFTDVAAGRGVDGSGEASTDRQGCSWADFDNDGDADIYINKYQVSNVFFVNQGGTRKWVKIMLKGVVSNARGIGARVKVYSH